MRFVKTVVDILTISIGTMWLYELLPIAPNFIKNVGFKLGKIMIISKCHVNII